MADAARAWPVAVRVLHWVSAALVLGTLGLGVYMVYFVHDAGARFELTQTHKSVGVTILALTVARLCARVVSRAPRAEPTGWLLVLAARLAHVALYVLLLAMPLSGWLMVTTTPVRVPTVIFGLFNLPYPLAPDLAAYRLAHALHVAAAISLALLVALHVAAAFAHALLWRDRTLARMAWTGKGAQIRRRESHLTSPFVGASRRPIFLTEKRYPLFLTKF